MDAAAAKASKDSAKADQKELEAQSASLQQHIDDAHRVWAEYDKYRKLAYGAELSGNEELRRYFQQKADDQIAHFERLKQIIENFATNKTAVEGMKLTALNDLDDKADQSNAAFQEIKDIDEIRERYRSLSNDYQELIQ